jgi:hypothetical protein
MQVCGRSLPGIAGSNPAGFMDVCLLWVLCVVRLSLRQTDHSSRGVIPSMVCLTEWDREASIMRRSWTTRGCCAMGGKIKLTFLSKTLIYSTPFRITKGSSGLLFLLFYIIFFCSICMFPLTYVYDEPKRIFVCDNECKTFTCFWGLAVVSSCGSRLSSFHDR